MKGIRPLLAISGVAAGLLVPAVASAGNNPLGSANGLDYYSQTSSSVPNGESTPALPMSCALGDNVVSAGAAAHTPTIRLTALTVGGTTLRKMYNGSGAASVFTGFLLCQEAALQLVSKSSAGPADLQSKTVKVKCPKRKHVVSGGFSWAPGENEAPHFVNASVPYDSKDRKRKPDDGWKATFYNAGGGEPNVSVLARCARPMPKYVKLASGLGAGPVTVGLGATCAEGFGAMGGGAQLSGAPAGNHVVHSAPEDNTGDGDSVPEDRWMTRVHSAAGGGTATAWAICRA
jgi:hypothetical protein